MIVKLKSSTDAPQPNLPMIIGGCADNSNEYSVAAEIHSVTTLRPACLAMENPSRVKANAEPASPPQPPSRTSSAGSHGAVRGAAEAQSLQPTSVAPAGAWTPKAAPGP